VEKKNSLKTVDDDSALENREYKPTAIGFDQSFFGAVSQFRYKKKHLIMIQRC